MTTFTGARPPGAVTSPSPGPGHRLLRYDENGGFWATPGGCLEEEGAGDHAAATARELGEGLGIEKQAIALGLQLAERSRDHMIGGHQVRQVERHFLTRVSAADVDPARATQPDNIREHRWWTLPELRDTADTVLSRRPRRPHHRRPRNGAPVRPVVLRG
ncbi:NUDIX domain-containing protein [Streptomyces sp. S3(2020)]|uniref:NUDIX domain-containing protein n=1 Tax=Streptomyces sp. S3(2020) TaxID=2732044 RepID=UPI0032165E04